MNCKECLNRLEELVDKELTPLEAGEVQMHLENCASCADHYEFQAGMKRLVRTCCSEDRAPDSLRERLRAILNS